MQFVGILNVPYISQSTQVHMQPFMQLAEMMGSLVAQTSESRIASVQLSTEGGKDVKINTRAARQLLEAKVLQGVLSTRGLEPDMISAPGMAREAGVESAVLEGEINNHHQYLNLVSVQVRTLWTSFKYLRVTPHSNCSPLSGLS